jgi:hypothetical protein
MAKTPRSRKPAAAPPRGAVLASPALRTVALRVGAAVALIAVAGGLYHWREQRAQVAAHVERPAPAVAAAPVKPDLLGAALSAAKPEPETDAGPTPEPPRREASLDAGKPMSNTLRAAFDAWLMGAYAKCWKAPKATPDGDPYLPKVRVAFREDGELAAPPKLVNPPSDPAWKPHAEAALKAVKGCDPLHVPDKYAEYYPSWKSRTVYFDPTRN